MVGRTENQLRSYILSLFWIRYTKRLTSNIINSMNLHCFHTEIKNSNSKTEQKGPPTITPSKTIAKR